jgi:tRNA threonylcarbamoyladenosine biosynthesis protein TsaB
MILILKTGTEQNLLQLRESDSKEIKYEKVWPASRELSEELPGLIADALSSLGLDYEDLTGIIGFKGPGSFTGLRIGITVINTIADQIKIPIVGISEGDGDLIDVGLKRLEAGENDQLIQPEYGGEANITTPRK